ncbi:bifunctional hydroxymethylpyrimidine kinase/phosphomethylpyrimidine kinase [Paeniglutamicibacter cryotolerans]|uniref:Hydroxymethylpyrimidine/phosphomethylpyrimidine kinase n=1 Tax=Paeniglutamicibacter cryotolerans TaxID=670079 RepID=A0A839QP36_9MICC|nr:bifunctional hydroxymethylpyrimidine kinase/phosphomethylpyrimidine kinase [Paeniglutamicibacter cryotolerans]MBB2994982.1 hydroxymethylpyrimidine/phosphomethylpyrimidine kinase [Paeniglutamicibacter cryotolerans]
MNSIPNILSIAGSDPSGGAGIQADLKSIAACGGYGMSVITALTAQNTHGVRAVHVPPAAFLVEQLAAVAADVRIDAIKIGMLGSAPNIDAVAAFLREPRPGPRPAVVLDPVMIATSGDRLLSADADAALRRLLPLADVITPNIPELAVLCDAHPAVDWATAIDQARSVAAAHGVLVLAKGGHLEGGDCPDALVDADGVLLQLTGSRIATGNTHGTGCSLSSALATLHARSGDWAEALRSAKAWLTGSISAADELAVGTGHGPVNHFAWLWAGNRLPGRRQTTAAWWERISAIREAIDRLAFIRQLSSGELDRADFEDYLGQDALYLRTYAQALSRASELAPTVAEQRFWAASASECLEDELLLHRGRLGDEVPEPSGTTTAYLNHLLASGTGYAVLAAALLPCFWIYQDVGVRLAAANHPGHPYADWLSTYASEQFDASTARAIEIVDDLLAKADEELARGMWTAFEASGVHELRFFAQTRADALIPGEAVADSR